VSLSLPAIALGPSGRGMHWRRANRGSAKRVLSVVSIVGLLFVSYVGSVCAADTYDGEWTGSATAARNGRCKNANVTLTVSGTLVLGQAKFDVETRNIHGTVQPDGSFGGTVGFQHLTGKFGDDSFEGTLQGRECAWTLILTRKRARAPTSDGPSLRFAHADVRGASAPIPKFATHRGTLSRELRNRKGTSNSMILVRL
jgi:hypothetical protein